MRPASARAASIMDTVLFEAGREEGAGDGFGGWIVAGGDLATG
jgi:hypothetical protein